MSRFVLSIALTNSPPVESPRRDLLACLRPPHSRSFAELTLLSQCHHSSHPDTRIFRTNFQPLGVCRCGTWGNLSCLIDNRDPERSVRVLYTRRQCISSTLECTSWSCGRAIVLGEMSNRLRLVGPWVSILFGKGTIVM